MTVHNLGSINIDLTFKVPRIPQPGETLSSTGMTRGLGGKGANTSIALKRAETDVRHYGAIGHDGGWALDALKSFGIDCEDVLRLNMPTGQAIIQVADGGENAITLLRGANWGFESSLVETVLTNAQEGEWLVLQNETAHVPFAAAAAKSSGLKVAYAAAPFDATAALGVLPHVDFLALNEIEASQLSAAAGSKIEDLSPELILVTQGARGATLYRAGLPSLFQPAMKVSDIKDTTAAGDTFLGFFLARFIAGDTAEMSLEVASAAAALCVKKLGASDAIPSLDETMALLS